MRGEEGAVRADAKILYDYLSWHEPSGGHADVLLILGSHDLRAADHAAALFLEGRADWLVCTGGYGKITRDSFREPEARLFARRCRALGVEGARILMEERSANTGENFSFSRQLLADRGIEVAAGLIVCKPYMARRALATARAQWPQPRWMVSPAPIAFQDYAGPDTGYEQLIELMVGDLQRMRLYAKRGFQAPVDVPESVWQAGRRLARAGYDRFVIRGEGDHRLAF